MVRALGVALLFLLLLAVPASARIDPPKCPLVTPLFTSKDTPLNLPSSGCGTLNVVTAPQHGTMATTDPTVYTPVAGFRGLDEFRYTITDADGTSDAARVEILVNTPPTCSDGAATVVNTQRLVIGDFACDEADGDDFSIFVGQPQHGTIMFLGDTVVYTPNPAYVGTDSFTYYAEEDDELGLDSEDATMTITVTSPPPTTRFSIPFVRPPDPAPKPVVAPDVTVPVVKLKDASKKQTALIALTTSENSSATLTLTLDQATARKLKLRRTVGQTKAALTPGTATVPVKLSAKARKAFRKLKRVKLTLTAVVSDTAGNNITQTLPVTLRK